MQRARSWTIASIALAMVVAGVIATTWSVQQRRTQVEAAAMPTAPADAGLAAAGTAHGTVPRGSAPPGVGDRDPRRRVEAVIAARNRDRAVVIAHNARIKDALASAWRSESADAAWAPAQEQAMRQVAALPAMGDADVLPRDLAVQCKRTTCRLDASFDSSGQADDWVLLYMSSAGGVQQHAVVSRKPHADGSVAIQVHSKAR